MLHLSVGDRLLLKKAHPCGTDTMQVLRTGSDIRLRCVGCGHDIVLPLIQLEKRIKRMEKPATALAMQGGLYEKTK